MSVSLTACLFPSATIETINSVKSFFESIGDRFTLDKQEFKRFSLIIQRANAIGAFDTVNEYNQEALQYVEKYSTQTWLNSKRNHKPLLMAVHRLLSNEFVAHVRYSTTRYLPEWIDIKTEIDAIKCIDRLESFLSSFAEKRSNVISNEIERYVEDMNEKYNISNKQRVKR